MRISFAFRSLICTFAAKKVHPSNAAVRHKNVLKGGTHPT